MDILVIIKIKENPKHETMKHQVLNLFINFEFFFAATRRDIECFLIIGRAGGFSFLVVTIGGCNSAEC